MGLMWPNSTRGRPVLKAGKTVMGHVLSNQRSSIACLAKSKVASDRRGFPPSRENSVFGGRRQLLLPTPDLTNGISSLPNMESRLTNLHGNLRPVDDRRIRSIPQG